MIAVPKGLGGGVEGSNKIQRERERDNYEEEECWRRV